MLKNQTEILEQAFDYFSIEKFEGSLTNKNTVITIQSRGKANCYGWCTVECAWYRENEAKDIISELYEINLSAEYINRSFYNTMETLLHEMVHLDNIINGINDCSKNQFHNEKFKDRAESIGLLVEKVKQYGWSNTTLSNELKESVDKFIIDNNINVKIFDIARKDKPIKKVARNNKKIKMICSGCKNIVSCNEEINITCMDCGIDFVKK